MGTLNSILNLLVQFAVNAYLIAMILRFLLQLVRADFYNPVSQMLVKVTSPLVIPLRRVLPGLAGIDLSSLLLSYAIQMAAIAALVLIQYHRLPSLALLLVGGALAILGLVLGIFFVAIIVVAIVSWVAPGTRQPVVYLCYQLTEPLMAPFRKVIPPMGGLDFSPMIAILLLIILRKVLYDVAAAVGVLGIAPWLS